MIDIELIFDGSCPNVKSARNQLKRALDHAGLRIHWTEWNRTEDSAPSYVYNYGSPTILVNRRDVTGKEPDECGSHCRLYLDKDGKLGGVPPFEVILKAIVHAEK